MSFKIDICDLLGNSLSDVKAELDNPENHKKLGELKFLDFMVGDKPGQSMRHGVYLFFNPDNKCAYIGKTNKQHFAKRIAAHFGMEDAANDNQYLRLTIDRDPHKVLEFKDYICHLPKMGDHSLVMIGVHDWKKTDTKLVYLDAGGTTNFTGYAEFVNCLEKFLQAVYCPPIEMKEMDGKPNDHFLNKQKSRRPLRKKQKKIMEMAEGGATLAELI